MLRRIRHLPSPSLVIALIALVAALGGTSYAAIKLPKNSVGSQQIKRNAVTGDKVKDGSLFANDFAAGQLPRGAKGDTGARGDTGAQGPKGDPGAQGQVIVRRHPDTVRLGPAAGAGADLVTMQLPPGNWSLSAVTNGFYDGSPGATFWCYLGVDGNAPEPAQGVALGVANGATRGTVFSPQGTVSSGATSTVVLRCAHEQAAPASQYGPDFAGSRIVATRADSLNVAAG